MDEKEELWPYSKLGDPKTNKSISNLRYYLSGFDYESFKAFLDLLYNTGSIIAGGSVLSAIHNEKINDIDIYSHKDGAYQIIEFFNKHYNQNNFNKDYFGYNISPAYDESFLRANNIKIRLSLNFKSQNEEEEETLKTHIDIMIVDNSIELTNVVSNFDLSFCQVYFDGKKFEAFQPIHVIEKSGILEDSYIKSLLKLNKFTLNRIDKYKKRGYIINYSGKEYCDKIIKIQAREKSKTVVSMEEWIVKKVYRYLIEDLRARNNAVKELITKSEFIVGYFLLLDFTYEGLLKLMSKTVSERCIIPGWLICHYITDSNILKHLLLYSLNSFYPSPFEIEPEEYKECVVDFIKGIGFPQIADDESGEEFISYIKGMKKRMNSFYRNDLLKNYYDVLSRMCILKKINARSNTELMKIKRKDRSIDKLNLFTKPSPISGKVYPEKELIDDELKGRCKDLLTSGLKNINAYLRGEKIDVFTPEGEKLSEEESEDYDADPVPAEEARRRLVFFLETKDGYVPVCYNLDMIEKSDIKSKIYSTTCKTCPEGACTCQDVEHCKGFLTNIWEGLNDPLFKLNMGDFDVYVYLKELLWALYKTKKQVFILTKPDPPIYFERTASLEGIIGDNWISVDHCQYKSDKTVYNIQICEEKDGNLCYPIIESNEIDLTDVNLYDDSYIRSIKIKAAFQQEIDINKLQNEADLISRELGGNVDCSDYKEDDDEEDEEDEEEVRYEYQNEDEDEDEDNGEDNDDENARIRLDFDNYDDEDEEEIRRHALLIQLRQDNEDNEEVPDNSEYEED
jgi:hypothetical protein